MLECIQILMNENNKSFYPSNMFEFIHHPEYGCRSLKGLKTIIVTNANTILLMNLSINANSFKYEFCHCNDSISII
jgi:hypothetical protein